MSWQRKQDNCVVTNRQFSVSMHYCRKNILRLLGRVKELKMKIYLTAWH